MSCFTCTHRHAPCPPKQCRDADGPRLSQDGDLLGAFLELTVEQQGELLKLSNVKSSAEVLCELIDALNIFVTGE